MGKFILVAILQCGIGCSYNSGDDDGDDTDTDVPVDEDAGIDDVLRVLSTLPGGEAPRQEADQPIVVTFSHAIRADSISADTFAVNGPFGAVPGSYLVEGDEVTFVPDAPLHLLGDHDVTLTGIASDEALPMAESFAWAFQVSEGGWGDRVDLAEDVGSFVDLARNQRGDMVLAFATTTQPSSIKAVRFDTARRLFSLPELLEESATPFSGPRAAINENGDVVVAWSVAADPLTRGWARRTGGSWRDATVEPGSAGNLGLTADGTAVMATTAGLDTLVEVLGPDAAAWTSPATAIAGATPVGVLQSAERAEVIAYADTAQQVVARAYVQGSGLAAQQPLSDGVVTAGSVHLHYLPGDDVAVSWAQAEAQIWLARFDGAGDTWSSAMLASGLHGSAVCENEAGARLAAFISADGSLLAAQADPGQDFSPAEDLGSPAGMEYARCAIDGLGNGVVVWAQAGSKSFQARYAGGEFTPATQLGDGPTMLAAVAEPGTGRVRALFYNGQKLTARAFE